MDRFNEDQTDQAIDIVQGVIRSSGKPLPLPEDVRKDEEAASTGDEAAYVRAMTARMRLIFPAVPSKASTDSRAVFWKSITGGRLEGIKIAESLDYDKAYNDGIRPALGSYFERWLSGHIKQELVNITVEGGGKN